MLVRLELLGPSERMTMESMTQVVLHEDMLKAGLRFLLLIVVTELLR